MDAFLLVLMVNAAVLALWVVTRFPRLAPSTGRGVTIALLISGGVLLGVPEAIPVVGGPLGRLAAIFLVVLPAFVYIFLVLAWIMLFVRQVLPPQHP